ncbi:MAG: N-acetylglucosamine-6-phosphate deacetylase [bacterium]
MKSAIYNGKVVTADRILPIGYVVMDGGLIGGVFEGEPPAELKQNGFDARGGWIAPGLCDIHIHGNGGFWGFMNADELLKMARSLVGLGVTAFLPTSVSLPHAQVIAAVKAAKDAMARQASGAYGGKAADAPSPDGARILGVNIEGPYISSKRPGAHLPMCIRNPKEKELDEIFAEAGDTLKIMTVAPEIEGGMELIDRLVAAGALPSIGHSDADAEQTNEAIRRGATHFTHLFNASRPFHQREPGCAFAALMNPDITVEIILDGKHVNFDSVKMAVKLKSTDKIVLITDAIHAAGQGDGEYNVWGFKVTVKNGAAKTPDGTMAGSVLTLNAAVKNAVGKIGLPPEQAFRMASFNGLRAIKMSDKAGELAAGKAADIAVFEPDFSCAATFIAGACVYEKGK